MFLSGKLYVYYNILMHFTSLVEVYFNVCKGESCTVLPPFAITQWYCVIQINVEYVSPQTNQTKKGLRYVFSWHSPYLAHFQLPSAQQGIGAGCWKGLSCSGVVGHWPPLPPSAAPQPDRTAGQMVLLTSPSIVDNQDRGRSENMHIMQHTITVHLYFTSKNI